MCSDGGLWVCDMWELEDQRGFREENWVYKSIEYPHPSLGLVVELQISHTLINILYLYKERSFIPVEFISSIYILTIY